MASFPISRGFPRNPISDVCFGRLSTDRAFKGTPMRNVLVRAHSQIVNSSFRRPNHGIAETPSHPVSVSLSDVTKIVLLKAPSHRLGLPLQLCCGSTQCGPVGMPSCRADRTKGDVNPQQWLSKPRYSGEWPGFPPRNKIESPRRGYGGNLLDEVVHGVIHSIPRQQYVVAAAPRIADRLSASASACSRCS